MKKLSAMAACAAMMLAAACNGHKSGSVSEIVMPLDDPTLNGTVAYLVNYDTGDKIDSTVVTGDTLRFSIAVSEPVLARVIVNGQRKGMVILEGGTLQPDAEGLFHGAKLNDELARVLLKLDSLEAQANGMQRDSIGAVKLDSLNTIYDREVDAAITVNADNPVGYFFFLQRAYRMDRNELDSALKVHPAMADSKRIAGLLADLEKKAETSVGMPYKDFEVKNDSVAVRLSQYVGIDGKFTLVDFWASWCGPCRAEIPVIKQIAAKHKESLNVVGVAVWDEPDATRQAIKALDIQWPVIIDAQRIPTDIYGISGIPCIILIDPAGTIVSRDLAGDALVAEVDKLIAAAKAATPLPTDSVAAN